MARDRFSLSERDLSALRLFRSVAEAGGLTAAEARTGLERSTVSRRIKALEARLGGTICLRGPRGFTLTEFGKDVLAAAVALDDTLEEVQRRLSRSKDTIRGELRLGLADNCITNPGSRIVGALAEYARTAPEVVLSVVIAAPADLLRGLREFRLNCCVVGAPLGSTAVDHDPLFTEEFRLYVRADLPVLPRFEELGAQGFGLIERAESSNPSPRALARSGLPVIRAEGLEAVATLLATGRYVGRIPDHYALSLSPVVPLVEVPGAEVARSVVRFSIVSRASRQPSRAEQHMRAVMRAAHREAAAA